MIYDQNMKREILNQLNNWKKSQNRKPVIMRGARQIGKTTCVRHFGASFKSLVELNFERMTKLYPIFEKDLEPHQIISDLQIATQKMITPGETLLFFDEVQACPRALMALRYFYELMPELHVIAAGSLLDFAIEEIGLPVGRVQFLYMYPMSFKEFLWALDENFLVDAIIKQNPKEVLQIATHEKALRLFGEYIAIGGMPEAVATWRDQKNYKACLDIHHDLITAYKQDFEKYARKPQIKYVNHVFEQIAFQLSEPIQYTKFSGNYRKRELEPALLLLEKANVLTRVSKTQGNGIPLLAHSDPNNFKTIVVDVAIAQALLGLKSGEWILNLEDTFINKGAIAEAFVGQELLAYSHSRQPAHLYYWRRDERSSNAEIDYLIAQKNAVIPVEVKSGKGSTLKSMHLFLSEHQKSPYGIRFSTQNYSVHEKVISYPIYSVMSAVEVDE